MTAEFIESSIISIFLTEIQNRNTQVLKFLLNPELRACYGLSICVTPNPYIEALIPNGIVFGGVNIGRRLGPKSGALIMRSVPL